MSAAVAPQRTCVGCRRTRDQDELMRLVADGGRLVRAWPGAPGRSAYLCPDEKCLALAEKRRAFAHAFRRAVTLDPSIREGLAQDGADERR